MLGKAFLTGAAFAVALASGGAVPSLLFFLAVAVTGYLVPFGNPAGTPGMLVVLLTLASFAARGALLGLLPAAVWVAIVAVLFYVILGIKNVFFVHRDAWVRLLYFAICYLALMAFFAWNRFGEIFPLTALAAGLFLATRDLLRGGVGSEGRDVPKPLAVWIMVFLIIEVSWAASLLPLPFLHAVNFVMAFVILLAHLVLRWATEGIRREEALFAFTAFVALSLLIFSTVSWNI